MPKGKPPSVYFTRDSEFEAPEGYGRLGLHVDIGGNIYLELRSLRDFTKLLCEEVGDSKITDILSQYFNAIYETLSQPAVLKGLREMYMEKYGVDPGEFIAINPDNN